MQKRWGLILVFVLGGLIACGRDVLWINWTIKNSDHCGFKVGREGVRDPVHGLVSRLTLESSGKVIICYQENPIAVFRETNEIIGEEYWCASSYLYTWFRFSLEDESGDEILFRELIGRFDTQGNFEVCEDITSLQDEYLNLMFAGVVDDETFRFVTFRGPENTEYETPVVISQCTKVDISRWLKNQLIPGKSISPPLPTPAGVWSRSEPNPERTPSNYWAARTMERLAAENSAKSQAGPEENSIQDPGEVKENK